jgi:hypothetical protein
LPRKLLAVPPNLPAATLQLTTRVRALPHFWASMREVRLKSSRECIVLAEHTLRSNKPSIVVTERAPLLELSPLVAKAAPGDVLASLIA